MGEHLFPGLSLGPQYIEKQAVLGGRCRTIVTAAQGGMVRRQPDGKRILVACPSLREGFAAVLRKAIAARLKVGLGKADRIERKAAR